MRFDVKMFCSPDRLNTSVLFTLALDTGFLTFLFFLLTFFFFFLIFLESCCSVRDSVRLDLVSLIWSVHVRYGFLSLTSLSSACYYLINNNSRRKPFQFLMSFTEEPKASSEAVSEYLESKRKYEEMRMQKLKKGSSREAQVSDRKSLRSHCLCPAGGAYFILSRALLCFKTFVCFS